MNCILPGGNDQEPLKLTDMAVEHLADGLRGQNHVR